MSPPGRNDVTLWFTPPAATVVPFLALASSFFLARAASVFFFASSFADSVLSLFFTKPLPLTLPSTTTTMSARIFFTLSCDTCQSPCSAFTAACTFATPISGFASLIALMHNFSSS
eukprot:CAMPEP_0181342058 /NCGR_PEP_ID=MMETSP1101-20121128/30787_1 /TAXON_ID=46948 /ORGANISM="Rhodomonas abbreviata, Strain Caron Lab Isolate" /LENGTH=115 /DNA_ID=CAMNT_0023453469 /DNA_START=232 /DNA_END=579 /DNA_ORIENTATION=-